MCSAREDELWSWAWEIQILALQLTSCVTSVSLSVNGDDNGIYLIELML